MKNIVSVKVVYSNIETAPLVLEKEYNFENRKEADNFIEFANQIEGVINIFSRESIRVEDNPLSAVVDLTNEIMKGLN